MGGFALPLITGGMQLLSGLFGGKSQTVTKNDSSSMTGGSNYNNTNSPVMSDFQESLAKYFIPGLMSQFQKDQSPDLDGYTTSTLGGINDAAKQKESAIANVLAQRGLSYSPAAATALAAPESERVGQQVDFMNQLPMLKRSLQQQDLSNLVAGFQALPTGSVQSGNTVQNQNTTSQSTTKGPSQALAGAFSGAGSGIATGYNMYKDQTQPGPWMGANSFPGGY